MEKLVNRSHISINEKNVRLSLPDYTNFEFMFLMQQSYVQ